MIEVPQAVKEALHRDTCHKNIRIHFPNGERSDINNDMIVKDSVSFKESLCSQNTLKFGLCESPVFECEVVGVGNIKGAIIEVSCEIEASLDVEGAEYKPDIGMYVYSIPYGIFIIEEAKRQADMLHRRIVAYGRNYPENFDQFSNNVSRQIITKKSYFNSDYVPDIRKLIFANLLTTSNNPFITEGTEYSPESGLGDISFRLESDIKRTYQGEAFSRYSVTLELHSSFFRGDVQIGGGVPYIPSSNLYKIKRTGGILNPGFKEALKNILNTYCLNYYTSAPTSFKLIGKTALVADDIIEWLLKGFLDDRYVGTDASCVLFNSELVYPYGFEHEGDSPSWRIYIPNDLEISVTVKEWSYVTHSVVIYEGTIPFYDVLNTDKLITLNIEGNPITMTFKKNYIDQDSHSNNRYVIDMGDFKLSQAYTDYYELLGLFGGLNRDGSSSMINIKQQFLLNPEADLYPGASLYPQGVTGGKLLPQDYQSCWYDDDYTIPYGALTCKYKNTTNQDVDFIYYFSGIDENTDTSTYKVYDLSNNSIIKSASWTEAQIMNFCQTIKASIEGVTYMPVDFVGRGLPYVEAGDTFEILTKSNDSITTIVLNRTITGEQTLTDSYKSV